MRAIITTIALAASAAAAPPVVEREIALNIHLQEKSSLALAFAPKGEGVAAFAWTTFEDEPSPAVVVVIKGETAPLEITGVWSAALDGRWGRLAVGERVKVIDATVSPPFSRAASFSRDFGATAAELESMLYFDSFAGNGYLTRPVIYKLRDGDRKVLAVVGGDFVDWADDGRLVLGVESGTNKSPGSSALRLKGYNLKSGALTLIAEPPESAAKLGGRLSPDIRTSPYLGAAWRLVWPASGTPPVAAVPAKQGWYETRGADVLWVTAEGTSSPVTDGVVLGASDDGAWLVVAKPTAKGLRVHVYEMKW